MNPLLSKVVSDEVFLSDYSDNFKLPVMQIPKGGSGPRLGIRARGLFRSQVHTKLRFEGLSQLHSAGQRVLVAAASNAAVDNVATALLAADLKLELARAGVPGA